jgi:hypothetical protein
MDPIQNSGNNTDHLLLHYEAVHFMCFLKFSEHATIMYLYITNMQGQFIMYNEII